MKKALNSPERMVWVRVGRGATENRRDTLSTRQEDRRVGLSALFAKSFNESISEVELTINPDHGYPGEFVVTAYPYLFPCVLK